jgi:dynein heavy chain
MNRLRTWHLQEDLKIKLDEAEKKRTIAEAIAENVAREKAVVEVETEKARIESEEVAKIQAEVSVKQRDTEDDLAKAEPAVIKAMAALDTLNKNDLVQCKTMNTPPFGVNDVFAATMVLLAGLHDGVQIQKNGKVKDTGWDQVKKQLLGNIPEYLDQLKTVRYPPSRRMVHVVRCLALE